MALVDTHSALSRSDLPLLACAACGIHKFDVKQRPFRHIQVGTLPPHFDISAALRQKLTRLKQTKVALPFLDRLPDGTHKVRFIRKDLSKLYSTYKDPISGRWLHLHPELVARSSGSSLFCHECADLTTAKKPTCPPESLANGIDFGNPHHIQLEMPNETEMTVLGISP